MVIIVFGTGFVWRQLTVIAVAQYLLFRWPMCMITILFHNITIRIQNLRSQFVLQQQHKLWSQILQFSLQSSTVSMILWLFIFMLWDNHISVFIKLSCDLKLFHVIVTCRNRVLCPWYTVIVYFRLCINLKTNLYISIVLWAVLSCIQRKLIHML